MTYEQFLEGFKDPPAEYGLQPFWFWNGDLGPAELLRQIGTMHEQGVTGFIIHARLGLTVPYLSETWFDRVALVLERARELGMIIWIYDEENWASGYAGGRVLARDPSLTPQCLSCERVWLDEGESLLEVPKPRQDDPRGRGEVVAVNACQVWSAPHSKSPFEWNGPHRRLEPKWYDQARFKLSFGECVSLPVDQPFENPGGRWLLTIHRRETTEWYPAYTDEYYVDVLRKETAPIFLEETHEQYWARFSEFFGSTIKGFFVDEPGLYNNFWDRNVGSIAWTEDFAEAFATEKGYDIRECLLALYEPVTLNTQDLTLSASKVRFDYYDFVGQLMQERFMQPLADWCRSKGVEHTGHLMLEEFMVTMARYAGNPFRQLSTLHTPGVDRIDEVYEKVAERIASSVAHLTGRKRVISETYALIGWKLAPPYMKEIFDYQAARGVNLLCPHAFYYSIEDFRKDECPPSEFFQNPWWSHFKPFADYVRRTCFALSQGKPVKDFLLYYPIDTIYTLISPEWPRAATAGPTEHWQLQDSWHPAVHLDQEFVKLVVQLEEAGLDFDLIDYTFLEQAEVVEGGRLSIGDIEVDTLVVPFSSYIPPVALARLRELQCAGGHVIRYRASEIDIPDALDLAPAPIQLIHHLRGLARERPFTTNEDADPFPRMRVRRTPSTANPQREQRRSPETGSTVCCRQLDSGEVIAFIAKPMDFATEGWRLPIFLWRKGVQLDRQLGGIEEEFAITDDPQGREFHAENDSLLLCFGAEPLERVDEVPFDRIMDSKDELELLDWEILWPDGTSDRIDGAVTWPALGRPFESGPATYRCSFQLDHQPEDLWIVTDLYETGEARLNGKSLGVRAFSPFSWNGTDSAVLGENVLEIVVAGTLTGKFEGKERLAGLQFAEVRVWYEDDATDQEDLVN